MNTEAEQKPMALLPGIDLRRDVAELLNESMAPLLNELSERRSLLEQLVELEESRR